WAVRSSGVRIGSQRIVLTFNGAPPYHTRHHPLKRVIQYSRAGAIDSRGRSVLDSPPSRGMTADLGARTMPTPPDWLPGADWRAEAGSRPARRGRVFPPFRPRRSSPWRAPTE